MAIRHVVKEGDAILRKHCREITEITDRIRTTMEDMLETMRQEQGVGIAGPQVGVMRRMFVAEPAPGEVYFMINPEILEKEGSQTGEEGCLSVPGLVGTVERPQKIRMRAQEVLLCLIRIVKKVPTSVMSLQQSRNKWGRRSRKC